MLKEQEQFNVEKLLAKAQKPSGDAMQMHPFYRGKIETTLKCCVRDIDDFAIWYTPGVAAPCRDIEANPERVYDHTSKWNTIPSSYPFSCALTMLVIGLLVGI